MTLPLASDAKAFVELIKTNGFWHLSGYDGCLCGDIKVGAFHIAVSCRKSDGPKIHVTSRHGLVTLDDVQKITDEVKRQYLEQENDPRLVVVTELDS